LKLKGIGGGPHKRWSMWLNSMQREEPYQGLTCTCKPPKSGRLRGWYTGGAWLSSARVVKCWVKSRNERNPHVLLPASKVGDSERTASVKRRKVGMTSSHHAPYALGCTHATMAGTKGCEAARWSQSQKAGPSSDWRLQLASMKSESLVTAGQQYCGEYVPGPCTHRPSRHESRSYPKPVR
jgi:hypothetical protein